MGVPFRENQCPERGPGLSHIRDSKRRPDGRCAYCGADMASSGIGGRHIPLDTLNDRPHAAICREGPHPAIVCFRFGEPEADEFLCWHHLIRIVRDLTA